MSPQVPTAVVSSGAPPVAQPQAATAQQQQQTQQPAEDVAALKTKIAELEGAVNEQQRNAQFWYDKAKAEPAKAAAPAADAEPEVDLLDLITTQGTKGLNAYLKKQGLLTKEEAEGLVENKAKQIAKESELVGRYPELKDHKSEFFRATAAMYGELKQAGVREDLAMQLAAEKTELEGIRAGNIKTPQQQTDESRAKREEDRRARAAAQAGERGGRTPEGTPEDDELTPFEKHLCAQMGITEEAYQARAKKGVQMGLRNAR